MTGTDRRDTEGLDTALRALPRTIEPGRDLWPGVAARLEARDGRRRPAWLSQAVAAVLLVAGSSLLTAKFVDDDGDAGDMAPVPSAVAPAAGVGAMPAAFGPAGGRLDAEYLAARKQLTVMLESRLASMPGSARAKLQVNLAEMRRAAEEINAALAEQPGDPLLEELLLKTYQDELAVLANVNQMTDALATTADPASAAERLRL